MLAGNAETYFLLYNQLLSRLNKKIYKITYLKKLLGTKELIYLRGKEATFLETSFWQVKWTLPSLRTALETQLGEGGCVLGVGDHLIGSNST